MKQILNIFRTDTRHFWPEILASFLVLALYIVHYPAVWTAGRYPSPFLQPNDTLTIFLVVAAWWLLIARVIHAESLVGQNQFWLTRPYGWKRLLAAKALFIVLWIYVPFVIAQMLVLAEAGFSPLGRASGWFFMLALYSGCFIVPLVAIAAVTTNFARMTLAVFVGYAAAVAFYISITDQTGGRKTPAFSNGYGTMVPYSHYFLIVALAILGGAAIVLLQYATRREWLSRALVISVALLAAGVGLALAKMPQSEIEHQYPAASSGAASKLQLAYAPTPENPLIGGPSPNDAFIAVPIQLSGVPEDSAVEVDDVQFSLDTAEGVHWTGSWRQLQASPFLPGTHTPSLPFILNHEEYERFRSQPVTLHVALAVTELHAGTQTTTTVSDPTFPVSGFGVCSTNWRGDSRNFLLCRSEFGELPLTYITAAFSNSPCAGPQPQANDVRTFAEWTGKAYSNPIDSGSDLVHLTYVDSGAYDSEWHLHGTRGRALCPGTSVHFTHYDVAQRSRAYLTIPNFQLPQPQPKQWPQQ